ncbi:MAG TPA: VOC family protein, partial [Gammaproteobacteria bacterium]|nr:VOC family protein [Gammaproteobacteria bacterium]
MNYRCGADAHAAALPGECNSPARRYYARMARQRGRPPHDDVLTPAEWRVVNFVRHGLTNRQIAARRGISLDAVKQHVASAVAKLCLRDRAALKTWAGAPKDSYTKEATMGSNDAAKFLGVGQIARSVADIEAAQRWYRDVLGLEHLYTYGDLAFFDCGGTRVMLAKAESEPAPESIVYLRVPDVHAAWERLQASGVEFLNAPHMIHRHADGAEEWMA